MAWADHLGPDYHPVDRSYIPPGGVEAATNMDSSYSIGVQGSNVKPDTGLGSSAGAGSFGNNAAVNAGSFGTSFDQTQQVSGPSIVAGSSAGTSDFTLSQGNYESASNSAPLVSGGIEKEFYTFTADEEDFAQPAATNQFENTVKQGIRVIFIKGPENAGLENAIVGLAQQSANQKTDIYVLTKQTDLSELGNKLSTVNDNADHKPEVHFVKYRTAEDAVHAQHAIQAEYEALGGPTQHFNGGVAPSLNFASQAAVVQAVPATHSAVGQESMIVAMDNVGSTYLPASVFRLFRL
uniref:DM5 domain-containing protein n=1 Tax=Musca domestica TaxID=7370 RepID=A0A1I8MN30_MUSDO